MHVSVRVQQHVVRLNVPMHDALLVNVAHRTPKLGHPETHCLLRESFSRDVESQVAAIHEIDYNVSAFRQPRQGRLVTLFPHTDIRYPGSCNASCREKGG